MRGGRGYASCRCSSAHDAGSHPTLFPGEPHHLSPVCSSAPSVEPPRDPAPLPPCSSLAGDERGACGAHSRQGPPRHGDCVVSTKRLAARPAVPRRAGRRHTLAHARARTRTGTHRSPWAEHRGPTRSRTSAAAEGASLDPRASLQHPGEAAAAGTAGAPGCGMLRLAARPQSVVQRPPPGGASVWARSFCSTNYEVTVGFGPLSRPPFSAAGPRHKEKRGESGREVIHPREHQPLQQRRVRAAAVHCPLAQGAPFARSVGAGASLPAARQRACSSSRRGRWRACRCARRGSGPARLGRCRARASPRPSGARPAAVTRSRWWPGGR